MKNPEQTNKRAIVITGNLSEAEIFPVLSMGMTGCSEWPYTCEKCGKKLATVSCVTNNSLLTHFSEFQKKNRAISYLGCVFRLVRIGLGSHMDSPMGLPHVQGRFRASCG